VQFILPAELTYSLLKRITLQDTFNEIADIFPFQTQPEGFIIFRNNTELPNINVIVLPQNNLIQITNPNYSSRPIQIPAAPHFPTRRPALGTPVTLPGMNHVSFAATVVAIKQNQWPTD